MSKQELHRTHYEEEPKHECLISALPKGLMLRSSRYYIRSVYVSRIFICVGCKKKIFFKISHTTWYHNKAM